MTELIDSIFSSPKFTRQPRLKEPIQSKKSRIISEELHTPLFNQLYRQNTFLICGMHNQNDLLIHVQQEKSHLIVRVYVLTKSAYFFRIPDQISRVQLIRHFSSLHSFYQLKINPVTGFLHFQFSFFQPNKSTYLNSQNEISKLLQQFGIQKLFQYFLKICLIYHSENLPGHKKEQKQNFNQGNLSLSIAKAVARTLSNPNLQKIVPNEFKPIIQSTKNYLHNFSQLHDFLETQKHHQNHLSLPRITKSLKEIETHHFSLSNLLKRKGRRSNYDTFLVSSATEKRIKDIMLKMLQSNSPRELIKIQQADLGKICLNLEKIQQQKFKNQMSFLYSLPKQFQYHFIDKYFKPPLNATILISISLKEENLLRYLNANASIMSYQTKTRILLQIYSGASVLWEQSKLLYFVNNLETVFVTKNLGVKLRGINCYYKPQKHVMLEDKKLVNEKIAQSLLYLSQLFFKLFHNQIPIYSKPSRDPAIEKSFFGHCRQAMILDKINMNKFLPENINRGTKRYIACLNYIFMEHIEIARKILKDRKIVKDSEKQKKIDFSDVFKIRQGSEQKIALNVDEDENMELINTNSIACWLLYTYC